MTTSISSKAQKKSFNKWIKWVKETMIVYYLQKEKRMRKNMWLSNNLELLNLKKTFFWTSFSDKDHLNNL